MKQKGLVSFILIIGISVTANAQSGHRYLRKGDKQYEEKSYSQAEENYRKALEKKPSDKGTYNLGNAIYQQKRYDDAARQYEEAAQKAKTPEVKAYAFHNQGNAYFEQKDYEKSVEAYKNALRLNPSDVSTKLNLALAQKRLQQMQQQQQEQQKKEQQKQEQQQQNQQQQQQPAKPTPATAAKQAAARGRRQRNGGNSFRTTPPGTKRTEPRRSPAPAQNHGCRRATRTGQTSAQEHQGLRFGEGLVKAFKTKLT